MLREDYLMRLIQQVADFLAQIAGHDRKHDPDAAIAEAARAWDELLGVPRNLVEVTDSATLAELLRDPAKIRAASQLLVAEARVMKGKGDPLGAAVLYRRALELVLEARALDPIDADDAMVFELSREVPASTIDARYR
jgi:hypothetical protein